VPPVAGDPAALRALLTNLVLNAVDALPHGGRITVETRVDGAAVVLAEAEIPKAMAEAFRSGNFGIMDYYRMKNVQADTSMREAIAKPSDGTKS